MGRRRRRLRASNVATAVHHTDTVAGAWDGPAAVAAMPNDESVLTYCHAWHEENAGDVKGRYKFPHHKTDGGPANTTGCSAGLGRLDQADIPPSERDAVRRHLQAHLDDARSEDSAEDIVRPPYAARTRLARNSRGELVASESAAPPRKFWSIKAAARPDAEDATDELWIYDEIGWSWFDDGITASSFAQDLAKLTAKKLTLRVNSPGGDVFDGIAIKNLIASHPAHITAQVDALAASIASVIVQAADEIVMMPHSQMMIHDAIGIAVGNSADMLDMAALLDMISNNIAQVYADAAGGDTKSWRKTMRGEKWYTAGEAVTAGLADRVDDAASPKRKTQPCAACDGTGQGDGEDCSVCGGTGRTSTENGNEAARADRLAVAASWCERLFPGHEQEFTKALASTPPTQPALPAPAAQGSRDSTTGTPTGGEPLERSPEQSPSWDSSALDALRSGVASVTSPPEINLGDWRSWFGEAPAARAATPAGPVDLGPAPERPAPAPNNGLVDAIRLGIDIGATNRPGQAAPAPAGPVDLGPAPERPAPAVRNPFIDAIKLGIDVGAANRPGQAAPAPAGPVDLGPAPERPAPAPTAPRNHLADLIGAAVDLAANDQPEPPSAAQDDPSLPDPPFRLSGPAVRQAIKESRY